jgi:hypothetical protein
MDTTGINEAKRFKVISGTRSNPTVQTLQLNGVTPDTRFTPRLAIRAAMAAVGSRNRVTVWAEGESHGYRLYANRYRRINLDYTI